MLLLHVALRKFRSSRKDSYESILNLQKPVDNKEQGQDGKFEGQIAPQGKHAKENEPSIEERTTLATSTHPSEKVGQHNHHVDHCTARHTPCCNWSVTLFSVWLCVEEAYPSCYIHLRWVSLSPGCFQLDPGLA